MEENQLITIDNNGFISLKELKIAKLSNNYLTLEYSFHGFPDQYQSPFHYCQSLEELYLANNSISEIFTDWIISDSRLRILDLKYNNITAITVSIWERKHL